MPMTSWSGSAPSRLFGICSPGTTGPGRQPGKAASRNGRDDGHRSPRRCRPDQNPRQAEGIVVMNNYFKAKGVNQPAIVLSVIVAAAAAYVAWLGERSGAYGYYWIAGVLAVISALI